MDIPKTDRVSTAIKTADEAQAFDETVRIAGTVDDSIVDGPGIRFTIFAQGVAQVSRSITRNRMTSRLAPT